MQDDKVFKPQLISNKKDGAWLWMWMAHYSDGTSLPQYDPYTLKTHTFREVNQDKLIKFGLYPFPPTLARRLVEEKGINVRSNIFLPRYEVNIKEGMRVIGALTTNFSRTTTYIICPSCNRKFKSSQVKFSNIGGNVKTHICPECGAQSHWFCKKCGKIYKHINKTDNWKCTKCGTRVAGNRVQFQTDSLEERWRIYKLGYQETIKGVNHKTIMEISENGDVEMKYK